ncbi:serine/threonine-protein kinase [Streptomyces sp. NPDC047014]|uniref:serine/threonine-protein kinase n=1 Tax=Streptomyces sp. NPDC047014 TaxID=3155736 RepID=UPI0033EEF9C8
MIGKLLNGAYKVGELVGGGGQGQLYEAVDIGSGRRVAVKVLSPRSFEGTDTFRHRREAMETEGARGLHLLGTPGIPEVQWHGPHGDGWCIVMDWVDGVLLEDAMLDASPVKSPATVAAVIGQLCGILEHVHAAGFVHRDIKPANVMIESAGGRLKLLDLGLAGIAGQLPVHLGGTTGYSAPEQFDAEQEVTVASDIYALGCVILAMTVMRLPYGGGAGRPTPGVPPLPRGEMECVPPKIRDLAMSMVAWRPGDRPASVKEVLACLRSVLPGPGDRPPAKPLVPDPTLPYLEGYLLR